MHTKCRNRSTPRVLLPTLEHTPKVAIRIRLESYCRLSNIHQRPLSAYAKSPIADSRIHTKGRYRRTPRVQFPTLESTPKAAIGVRQESSFRLSNLHQMPQSEYAKSPISDSPMHTKSRNRSTPRVQFPTLQCTLKAATGIRQESNFRLSNAH